MKTHFTYYTIIGRDPHLLRHHLENVTEYAGFNDLECSKTLMVIVYRNANISEKVTEEILSVCEQYKATPVMYDEPVSDFITNLYACWNLGYEKSQDGFVFRGGSDQVFSKGSFPELYRIAEETKGEKLILQANTVENSDRIMAMRCHSRHMLAPLGNTFDEFRWGMFEGMCDGINSHPSLEGEDLVDIELALNVWGKPTFERTSLGIVDRCDGCSWLMTRNDWVEHGPLPITENGITGDVVIHDRLQSAGYTSKIVKECITYHFVRGESQGIQ
jgi:hypothetical protein